MKLKEGSGAENGGSGSVAVSSFAVAHHTMFFIKSFPGAGDIILCADAGSAGRRHQPPTLDAAKRFPHLMSPFDAEF
jgi:hypothetical protein